MSESIGKRTCCVLQMFRSPIIYIKHSPEFVILVHYLYVYYNVEIIFKLIYYRTKQMFQGEGAFSFAASDSMLRSYGPVCVYNPGDLEKLSINSPERKVVLCQFEK